MQSVEIGRDATAHHCNPQSNLADLSSSHPPDILSGEYDEGACWGQWIRDGGVCVLQEEVDERGWTYTACSAMMDRVNWMGKGKRWVSTWKLEKKEEEEERER